MDLVISLDYKVTHQLAQGHGPLVGDADGDQVVNDLGAHSVHWLVLAKVGGDLLEVLLLRLNGEGLQQRLVDVEGQRQVLSSEDVALE